MQPKRGVPESFLGMEDDLLVVRSYWDHVPEPEPGWIDQSASFMRRVIREQPWKSWHSYEWINALVFVGVGLAVLGNVVTFVGEVRRASTVR